MSTALVDRLAPDLEPSSDPLGAGEDRARARQWLDAHGLPTSRAEEWRYSTVDDILTTAYQPAPLVPPGEVTVADVDALVGDHGPIRLVFLNGAFAPDLSRADGLAGAGRGGADRRSGREPASRPDGFEALNLAAGREAAVLVTEPHQHLDEPVQVVHLALPGDQPSASHPRTTIDLAEGSSATVIESYAGLEGAALTNAATAVVLGAGADLRHAKVAAEATEAVHLAHTRVHAGEGSRFRSTSVLEASRVARHAVDVVLAGRDATADLAALHTPVGEQVHEHVLTVEHAASGGASNQLVKGIVDDRARGAFTGRIIVRPDVTGTDAHQTNHNLLLSRRAEADTRPWLEILADDVRCTHGATVGRLDEEALFYLRSRGIPAEVGRAMLVEAFAAEVRALLPWASEGGESRR